MRPRHFLAAASTALALLAVLAPAARPAEPLRKEEWHNRELKFKNQFKRSDVRIWLATLFPADFKGEASPKEVKATREILGRLFLLIDRCGVEYRKSYRKKKWIPYPHPTASVLSHGGKLLIAVKDKVPIEQQAVLNWVMTGELEGEKPAKHKVLKKRWWRYKKIAIGLKPYDTELVFKKGAVTEMKARKTTIDKDEGYWGVDIGVGGYGGEDQHGAAIDDDGHHGHLLWYYRTPPKKEKGWKIAYLLTILPGSPKGYMKRKRSRIGHQFEKPAPAEGTAPTPKESEGDSTREKKEGGALAAAPRKEGKDAPPEVYQPGEVSITGGLPWSKLTCPRPGVRDCLRVVIEDKKELDECVELAKKILKKESKLKLLLRSAPKEDLDDDED